MDLFIKNHDAGVFGGIDGHYCGGNQKWFTEVKYQKQGCGPTAASNITAYQAQINPARYGALYPYPNLSAGTFTAHMQDMLRFVTPSKILPGFWFIKDFIRGVQGFAREHGVSLSMKGINNWRTSGVENAAGFIRQALRHNSPPALVAHYNPRLDFRENPAVNGGNCFMYHWVTIIGMAEKEDGGYTLRVSSWGEWYELPLLDAWTGSYAGLAIIEP